MTSLALRRLPPFRARVLAGALFGVVLLAVWLSRSVAFRRHARSLERHLTGRHPRFHETIDADRFQRGNLHTHSLLSDGSSPVEAVVAWYRSLGYQFVAMTEHNLQIDASLRDALSAPGFVVLPGEEVTNHWGDRGGRPLHVNALCAPRETPGGFDFVRPDEGLAGTLEDIRAEGGIPLVNHPNFQWTLTEDDIARGASGRYLLEIWSGHPSVNPGGDGERPSAEAIWDGLLARGADAIPVAVDDTHNLPGDPSGGNALPGRAWVETFGGETSTVAICAALARGDLYASNGPALARISVQRDTFLVATTDPAASVVFLGERGETLAQVRAADVAPKADVRELTYRLTGGETLVRARVSDAAGRHAWTAAYRVDEGA